MDNCLNNINHFNTTIDTYNNKKIGVSRHIIETTKDIKREYHIVSMADFHGITTLPAQKKNTIKTFLEDKKGKIDLIVIPGDIESGKKLLEETNNKKTSIELNELSKIAGNVPIYITCGNHEFGVLNNYDYNKVVQSIKSIQTNNIIALINECDTFNCDIDIFGIYSGAENYKTTIAQSKNPEFLNKYIALTSQPNATKFNISLIHDCWKAYYSQKTFTQKELLLFNYDLIVAGHAHGGYLSAKKLCNTKSDSPDYGIGYTDDFSSLKVIRKMLGCYGAFNLSNDTVLSINEGINRFNGIIPSFVNTIPFVTEIKVRKKKLRT